MSKEAMDWVLEFAPPMPSQLIPTLSGLARHADKKGCGAYPSVARLAAYACKTERSVQRDLAELRKLGLIRYGDRTKTAHLPEGKRPDVYNLAIERVVPGGRAGSDEMTQASRVTLTSSRRRGGKKIPSSGPETGAEWGDVDVTPDVDVTGDVDVADGVTWTSQEGRRGRHPNQKKNPTDEPKTSSSTADDHLEAFGAFWSNYPKKIHMAKAKAEWIAAVRRGVDPAHMVTKAQSYARAVVGQDPQFTSFPANWLANERYHDEYPEAAPTGKPHLRAVSGGNYRPFQLPEDVDYSKGF